MKVESCCSIPPLSLPLAPLPPSRVPVPSSQHAIVFQHSYPNTNRSSRNLLNLRCGYQRKDWNPNPEVDTRIHWNSPDEGWISSSSSSSSSSPFSSSTSSKSSSALDDIVSDLVSQASDSHYEFLGVPADADGEKIKASYRKLSKLYHPDTTTLPLEVAAKQFLRLQEAYDVLSNIEERRFYDWNLAQEVSRQQGGGFVWPYEVDQTQKVVGSQIRYATKDTSTDSEYVEFTGQIWAALLFDAFALLVAILSAVYVAFFKN